MRPTIRGPARTRWDEHYECPKCGRVRPWTDGTVKELGDEGDEYWCQVCGEETPLEQCQRVFLNDQGIPM